MAFTICFLLYQFTDKFLSYIRSFSLQFTTEYCDYLNQIFNKFLLFGFFSIINLSF